MRVEIIQDDNCYVLEKAINDFLKQNDFIKINDIKYTAAVLDYRIYYSAMIIYEEVLDE